MPRALARPPLRALARPLLGALAAGTCTLALASPDSALARLDILSKAWWDDQTVGRTVTQGQIAPPARPLTLLDGERADPTTWLALNLILGLQPADRWRVSNGQTFVQRSPDADELRLMGDLGARVGLKHPKTFEIRTEASTIVWVGLSTTNGTVDVPVAWPADWRTVEAARAMHEVGLPSPTLQATGLVDPSFEDELAERVAWWTEGTTVLDAARTSLGAHSVQLEGQTALYQRVAVRPGVSVTVHAKLCAQGSAVTESLVWEDEAGKVIGKKHSEPVSDQAWQDVALVETAPAGAFAVEVRFDATGDGFANADDVRFTRSDVAAGTGPHRVVRAWAGTAVRLFADPAEVPDAETHLTHIDQAVRGALGLLGQPTASVVDIHFATSVVDAGGEAACIAATDADATACVLRQDLQALWGAPGNPLFAAAFSAALSGADLPPQQGDLDAGLRWTTGPPPASWVSFSRWLLDQYGTAAVRAAWQSADLQAFKAGRKTLPELERAWRQ